MSKKKPAKGAKPAPTSPQSRLVELLNQWSVPEVWESLWEDFERSQDRQNNVHWQTILRIWQGHCAELSELVALLPTDAAKEMPSVNAASKPGSYTAVELAEQIQRIAITALRDEPAAAEPVPSQTPSAEPKGHVEQIEPGPQGIAIIQQHLRNQGKPPTATALAVLLGMSRSSFYTLLKKDKTLKLAWNDARKPIARELRPGFIRRDDSKNGRVEAAYEHDFPDLD